MLLRSEKATIGLNKSVATTALGKKPARIGYVGRDDNLAECRFRRLRLIWASRLLAQITTENFEGDRFACCRGNA